MPGHISTSPENQGNGVSNQRPPEEQLAGQVSRRALMAMTTRPRLGKFVPVETAGPVVAHFEAELPSGMIVDALRLMKGARGYWIGLPAIRVTDRDGAPVLDDRGKSRWRDIIRFRDQPTKDRFAEMLLAAIREQHPEIFKEHP